MTEYDAAAFRRHFDVSRETEDALHKFSDLLRKWTPKINLISTGTVDTLWTRHLADSAQLWDLAPHQARWVDLGSGGGFPGLVVAVLGRDCPGFSMTLVEADQRKSAFLRTAVRELDLEVDVVARRIDDIRPLNAEVLTARALAPLPKLLSFAHRHLLPDGVALFPKGAKAKDEVNEALEGWRFRCQKHASITDANSTILSVGEIARV